MTVGAYEAKTKLPALLERVAKGETITITKHGVPVAMLVPPSADAERAARMRAAVADIRRFREEFIRRNGRGLTAEEIKEMINEGRRM